MRLGATWSARPDAVQPLAARAPLSRMTPRPVDWSAAIPADGDPRSNMDHGTCWPIARRWIVALRRAIVTGDKVPPAVPDILADYSALTGFDPATGLPDAGTDTTRGMTDWVCRGVRVNDQVLDIVHWLHVDPSNVGHIAIALAHAGPLMATWTVPRAMLEPAAWCRAPGDGPDWNEVVGEHETVLVAADGRDGFTTRTWGLDLPVHPEVLGRYLIAVDVPLDLAAGGWCDATGLTPAGLDREALAADMAAIAAA